MSKQTDMKMNMAHTQRLEHANEALKRAVAELPKDDSFRLRYHFMPVAAWMNDPNGLIFYKNEYHVFYQHNPYEPNHGPMYWGHAKTKDLITWEHLPIALAPSEVYDLGETGGYGCWSGSAVDHNGVLTLIYTGHVDGRVPEEVQCVATSADGVTFNKAAHNPVIANPPEEGGFGFRDPKVWQHEDVWYTVIGYGKDGLGKALLYTSPDLQHWTYIGIAAESDGTMGNMWECPDLFPVGDSGDHVLICSPMNMGATKTLYLSGKFSYETGKLDVRYQERLDYGFDFYAPQTLEDARGRRILIGWMNIWGAQMPEQKRGWMGAFTLPRELTMAADGTIRMKPVEELKALRGEHHTFGTQKVSADTVVPLAGLQSDVLEIVVIFNTAESAANAEYGLQLRSSEDGRQYTEVVYAEAEGKLKMDRSRSGQGEPSISEAELSPMSDGRISLHIFLDCSSVELFANDGAKTITNRIYPDPTSLGIRLFARKGEGVVESLDVWELQVRSQE
ncbi:glycoside hydrolase family 32 protein [Paenibacillus sp. GCM10027628]|uniref:glycoside hydrolase family 32 protein n=1 Tax=Paenibacillus sp. GCM10027628 TaxID=3273413 RepID=UPI003625C714